MVRHIVLLTLQPDAPPERRDAIVAALATLPARIPEIRSYEFSTDLGLADGNAHLGVVADFDDLAGYEAYRDHPAHREVIAEHIAPVLAHRSAIQMELRDGQMELRDGQMEL